MRPFEPVLSVYGANPSREGNNHSCSSPGIVIGLHEVGHKLRILLHSLLRKVNYYRVMNDPPQRPSPFFPSPPHANQEIAHKLPGGTLPHESWALCVSARPATFGSVPPRAREVNRHPPAPRVLYIPLRVPLLDNPILPSLDRRVLQVVIPNQLPGVNLPLNANRSKPLPLGPRFQPFGLSVLLILPIGFIGVPKLDV